MNEYALRRLATFEETVAKWERAAAGTVDDQRLLQLWSSVAHMCFVFSSGSPYLKYGWDERTQGERLAGRIEAMSREGSLRLEALEGALLDTIKNVQQNLNACEAGLHAGPGVYSIDLEEHEFDHDVMYQVDTIAFSLLLMEKLHQPKSERLVAAWGHLQDRLRSLLPRILEFISKNDYVPPRNRDYWPESFWWWRLYPALTVDPAVYESHMKGETGVDYSVRRAEETLNSIEEPVAAPMVEKGDVFNLSSGVAWLRILVAHGRVGNATASDQLRRDLGPRIESLCARFKSLDRRLKGRLSEACKAYVEDELKGVEWSLGRSGIWKHLRMNDSQGNGSVEQLLQDRDSLEYSLMGLSELATVAGGEGWPQLAPTDERLRAVLVAAAKRDPAGLGALLHGSFPSNFWWRNRGEFLR